MIGQRIPDKYLIELMSFFSEHPFSDPHPIYINEGKFKYFLGVQTFKFINSGTSALHLILHHLRSPDRETIVWGPGYTHISWVNCANWLGYKHDFVDVKKETLCLDPIKLLEKIETDGAPDIVVMVDMCGYVGEDTIAVKRICEANGIVMVEDAAHAFGQKYAGKYSGTFGDYGFYSFSTPKLLTVGEGGAIVCQDQELNVAFEEMLCQAGFYRYEKKRYTKGLNLIMSNWLTELLSYQLRDINEILLAHYNDYQHFLKKTPGLHTFDSDNECYAPSFFVRQLDIVPENIINGEVEDMYLGRYTNLADPKKYPVSQELQDTLVFWHI